MEKESIQHTADVGPTTNDHVAIKTDTYAIDEAALGHDLPKHYYRSIGFIGTVTVSAKQLPSSWMRPLTWTGTLSGKYQQLLGLDHAVQLVGLDQRRHWTL